MLTPGNLLTAARHAIVSRAVADGCGEVLATAYREAAFLSVMSSLERMGLRSLGMTPPGRPGPFIEGVFSFDSDKVAHVLLTADPLTDWSPDVVFGHWDAADLRAAIPAAQSAARRRLFDPRNPVREVLHLTVIAGVGRSHSFGYNPLADDPRCRTLDFSPEALHTLSWLEDTQQLTLWQFVQAHDDAEQHARVMAFDPLDEYGFYRTHGCSFYATDDGRPTMLSLIPDFAESLRCDAHDRADRIGVRHPDTGRVVELFSFHAERAVPLHCPHPDRGMPFMLHVGGLPMPVWVVAPGDEPDARYSNLRLQFIDLVAYWLWQLSDGLRSHLAEAADRVDQLVVEVDLLPSEGWFTHEVGPAADDTLTARAVGWERVRLTVGSGLEGRLATADNAGEREVVRTLLAGLRAWGQSGPADSLGRLTDPERDAFVDQFAPLGPKKKLLMLDAGRHPALNPAGLPLYRPVQAFEQQRLQDEVGHAAGWQFGPHPQAVPDDDRGQLLNSLVGHLYGVLERLVAELSPDGLLEALVAQNERVIYEREFRELTVPTRIACFGERSRVIERLAEELPETATAGLAGRFLIEYVAARPPAGEWPFSLGVYDRLLALAAQIITFGMSSDALRYGLSTRSLEVLASGRLALDASPFEATLDGFRATHAAGVADRSHTTFGDHWEIESRTRPPAVERLLVQMEAASAEEFGIGLRELNEFLGELISAGLELPGEPKVAPLGDLVERLATGFGWDRDRVRLAVEPFALRPRAEYLTPPDGFAAAEVFPWRFNRRLSHVRRPLLVRATPGGETVVWGVRLVGMAAGYLTSLCTGGRLIARTRAMRQAMGAFHTYQGDLFNRRVANLYRTAPGLLVQERVKKVGGRRIARANGQDLGDLDVLVADPSARVLTPVETKDLYAALTPPELRNEMDRLFGSADGTPGDLDRFAERVGWVRDNLREVLGQLFGVDDPAEWVVRPVVVLDRDMISPRLAGRVDFRVLSVRELQATLPPAPVAGVADPFT